MKATTRILAITVITAAGFAACNKKKGEEIKVYPNPATTYIVFDAGGSSKFKNGEITVKDMLGQTIKTFKTADSSRIQWQVDTFQRGLYNYWYTADKMKTQMGKIQLN